MPNKTKCRIRWKIGREWHMCIEPVADLHGNPLVDDKGKPIPHTHRCPHGEPPIGTPLFLYDDGGNLVGPAGKA